MCQSRTIVSPTEAIQTHLISHAHNLGSVHGSHSRFFNIILQQPPNPQITAVLHYPLVLALPYTYRWIVSLPNPRRF